MASDQPIETHNVISGGIQFGPVLQGRDVQAIFQIPAAAPVALAQLPASVAGFTGRDDELTVLSGLLDPAVTAGPVVVSAVAGLAGVGKTTLAIEAGHAARRQGWFGGGVLLLDLHGYDEVPVKPGQALDVLLRALGVPAEHIPPGTEARAGLYRSVLAEIPDPVLVIADNASTEAQVRPLLPGIGSHRVVVTSRHTLAGLGARLVDVRVLDQLASMALLNAALRIARPGDDRITGDPEAAERLAGVCGGLPLALQIVAALLKADPGRAPGKLADELAVERERLERMRYDDGSGGGGLSVAAAFELSYRRLEEVSARCSGCCRLIRARTCLLRQSPSLPTSQSATHERSWQIWPEGTWPRPPRAPRTGGGCMTCCACTPGGSLLSTRMLIAESRLVTGCSVTTSALQVPLTVICGCCPGWSVGDNSPAGIVP